jgi:surface protein
MTQFIAKKFGSGFDGFHMKIYVTTGDSDTEIPFGFSATSVDCVIDWGDGSTESVTGDKSGDEVAHTYTEKDREYDIKITGTIQELDYANPTASSRNQLREVLQWGSCGWLGLGVSFYRCANLTEVNATDGYNLENCNYFGYMFYRCNSLLSVNLSGWITTNSTDFRVMFYQCYNLTDIDVSDFDMSNAEKIFAMFYECDSPADSYQLNVTGMDQWNVANVDDAVNLFFGAHLDDTEYDKILVAWAAQAPNLQSNVTATFGSAKYTESTARGVLTGSPYNWSIADGGPA